MPLQHPQELIIKAHLPMMLFLRIDVANRVLKLGNAGAESAIAILPGERPSRQMIVDPFGRAALNQLNGLSNGYGCRQRQQDVGMVFHSSHRQRFEFIHTGDSGHVRPEFFLEIGWNQNPSPFGGKDAMGGQTVIGVGHGPELYILVCGIEIPRCASRPLRGLESLAPLSRR